MNDRQSSVQNYRTCREVLQGLSWDAYGEEWGPPMRHLFFSLINASDPRNCSSQAGYHRAKSDGTFAKAMMLRNMNSVDCPAEPKISSARQPRAIARMTANDYFEIVSSWVQNKPEWKLSDDCRSVLVALCAVHAKIHEMAVLTSDAQILSDLHDLGSLHHLWRGVRAIFDPIGISVLEHNYVSATGNEWLRGQLQEHASEVLKKDRIN